jgi:hypothetical protein
LHARLWATTTSSGWSERRPATGRQRALRHDTPPLDDDDPAAELREAPDGERHVLVVRPDHHEVVGVMGDRGSESAALEPRPREEPEPDTAGGEVTLDHGELDEVALGVRDRMPVDDERLDCQRLGHDLVLDQPDRAGGAASPT